MFTIVSSVAAKRYRIASVGCVIKWKLKMDCRIQFGNDGLRQPRSINR